jgi:hypothetical protein
VIRTSGGGCIMDMVSRRANVLKKIYGIFWLELSVKEKKYFYSYLYQ